MGRKEKHALFLEGEVAMDKRNSRTNNKGENLLEKKEVMQLEKKKKKGMNSSDYLLSLLRENKIRIKKNSNTAKSNVLLTLIPDKIYGTQTKGKQALKKLHQCQVEKEDRNQGK